MPHLSEIAIYPIKSCAGLSVRAATLTASGLMVDGVHDREWMVIDPNGQFLSQREHPRMARIVPRIVPGKLILSAPGLPEHQIALGRDGTLALARQVQVWDDQCPALDQGDACASWFEQAIGVPCRLVRFDHAGRRVASAAWTGGIDAPLLFADGFPLLIIGAASLRDLNTRLCAAGRAALPMDRFRPNLVIDGMHAYEEDFVEQFGFGAAQVRPVKPCARCTIPAVDQARGELGPSPLDIMQSYRANARLDGALCFGMNALIAAGMPVTLVTGQSVELVLAC